jgi:hypothetical protein
VLASVIALLSRGKELVELLQIRHRHVQTTHRFRLFGQVQGRPQDRTRRPLPHALENPLDVVAGFGPALLDGALHHFGRMLLQRLHDPDVLLDAPAPPVLPLQIGPQLGKERRQLPAAEDRGAVQRRRFAVQRRQIVLRIQALLVPAIRPRMLSDHLARGHDRDVVYVALDRDGLKRHRARRAVTVVVETHGLVLVHLGRLEDARIKWKRWQ